MRRSVVAFPLHGTQVFMESGRAEPGVLHSVDLGGGSGEAVCVFTSGYGRPQTPEISPGHETAVAFSPR